MHAANLLNKRRQHREEHRHPAVAKKATNPNLLETSSSNPSLCSAATGITSSSRPLPPPVVTTPVAATIQEKESNGCPGTVTTTPTQISFDLNSTPVIRDRPMFYHYSDHFNCANIGLCIMIAGVVIMTISGFICYLIGFGEPGVIIGVGGAGFVFIGLIVLSFGNSWYASREKARLQLPYDAENGRGRSVNKRYPQDSQTNRSGLNADKRPTSGVEFGGIIPE